MHNRLIRLILKIALPPTPKLMTRPTINLPQLLLRRPNLDTRLNPIRRQRSRPIDIPLVEHRLLGLWVASHKVVEGLDVWFGAEDGEREVVVLEVETDAGEIDEGLDACAAELLWVADAGALEDEWGAEGAARDDDLFAGADGSVLDSAWGEGLAGDGADSDCAVAFEDDLNISVSLNPIESLGMVGR